jgi:hypothetical protein
MTIAVPAKERVAVLDLKQEYYRAKLPRKR